MLVQVAFELLDPAGVDQRRVRAAHGPAHQGDPVVVRAETRALDVEEYAAFREARSDAVELPLREPLREERDVAASKSLLGCIHGREQCAAALAEQVELDGGVADEVLPVRNAFGPQPCLFRRADSREMQERATEQLCFGHGQSPTGRRSPPRPWLSGHPCTGGVQRVPLSNGPAPLAWPQCRYRRRHGRTDSVRCRSPRMLIITLAHSPPDDLGGAI